ncbi:hypothetical protein KN815_40080 [Streptomyces sp. 4503]|uniref:Uncharacterized protein n=1 Tax=Streptomyces niphimycinicus TaxID=2842201 RepID=A0ABS6CSU6_9ACTN|nr:hypothetical protein [Streptomyces niphimycinicus]MBU3870032.1 hypothetical protein [Streptomyces niphimycinicus]
MTYTHSELNLTDPTKGYAYFVLYTEPRISVAGAAWNATVNVERPTPYVQEWLDRLQRCEPNALHTTLVQSREITKLFHPCVDEDKASPSALGDGCTCFRTFVDPIFGMPVVGQHFRTARGNNDRWTYTTYAPLDLRPDDVVASVVIDRGGLFWARTNDGVLAVLSMLESYGYGPGRALAPRVPARSPPTSSSSSIRTDGMPPAAATPSPRPRICGTGCAARPLAAARRSH